MIIKKIIKNIITNNTFILLICTILTIFTVLTINIRLFAQSPFPISTDSLQLQKLIDQSEKQIKSLKQIVKYKKHDNQSLEKVSQILEVLSQGIDKSIEKYQGTEIYEKALLQLQSKNNFKKTYFDSRQLREKNPNKQNKFPSLQKEIDEAFEEIIDFQKNTVKANQSDLKYQDEIKKDLQSAKPGFVPKIQAQTQLGNWQANTRISAQLTELLAAIYAVREELRLMRLQKENENSGGLNVLVRGMQEQNEKLKGKNE